MTQKSNRFTGHIKTVLIAAAVALFAVPALTVVSEPIEAKAYYDSVRDKLNDNEKKLYDAYGYLNSHVLAKGTTVTVKNRADFNSSNFFELYKESDNKFVYSKSDRKYSRRAFIFDDPMDISRAMVDMKFLYVQDKTTKKYSCYAYLVKTTDSDYKAEEKQLSKAIGKIMDVIDDSGSAFATELQIYDMIYDNVTYTKTGISKRELCNTAYGALVQHRASSQGYALAFAALMDEADIDNNILSNDKYVWNQVRISGKTNGASERWYEVDTSYSDRKFGKRGMPLYTLFNVPTRDMDRVQMRADFFTNFRRSTGTDTATETFANRYNTAILEDTSNLGVAILNDDGTVTRSTLFTTELQTAGTTIRLVPVFTYGKEMENLSDFLSTFTINVAANSPAFKVTTPWSKETGYALLTLDNPAGDRTLDITMKYADSNNTLQLKQVLSVVDDTEESTFVFTINGDNAYLKKCNKKNLKNAIIPAYVTKNGKQYKVTKVSRNAFRNCRKLERVILGANIKEVEENAFSGKTKLIRVETNGFALKTIGDDAFRSADENTLFLIRAQSNGKFEKIVKKIKRSGANKSVYKFRYYLF